MLTLDNCSEFLAEALATNECAKLRRLRLEVEYPRGRGHLIARVCPTQREGCGVHAQDAPAVSRGVPS